MADQFDNPGTASALDLAELNGSLLLIKPIRVEVGIHTTLGPKDATVADVHILDGDSAGEVAGEAFIWPKVLQVQLRSLVGTGRWCLGRLGQGVAKPGQSPPWKLADPTDADKDAARRYLNGQAIAAPDDAAAEQPATAADSDDDVPPWEREKK